jgi:asparagine synthase (glutamine-hydrolysing)
MCGIAGLTRVRPDVVPLTHRGPDGHQWTSIGCDDGSVIGLLHTRLAIVDLSDAGNQPMSDETGRFTMVFNGEIYNHLDLRQLCLAKGHRFRSNMDGEVILHLWEMEGPACLKRLNGIFALAVTDRETGELFLARDPLGVKPVLYTQDTAGDLIFGSEATALRELGADLGPPSVTALARFLTFLWVPNPDTPFSKVRSLRPGHLLRWKRGRPISDRAYQVPMPHPDKVRPQSMASAVDELEQRLGAASQRQLLGDVPIGLMASGGIDSSLIWQAAGSGIDRAFTIDWRGADDEGIGEDAKAVALLERHLGTPVTYLDGRDATDDYNVVSGDLFADPAYELTRLISRKANEMGRKVLLSGQGGDEVFGGYRRHQVAPLLGRAFTGPLGALASTMTAKSGMAGEFATRMARASARRDPFERYMELCTYSATAERARALGVTEREVSEDVVWAEHRAYWDRLPKGLSFLRKAMALDLGVYLPGLGLSYVDRAGMEFGMEIRVPLLDLDLLEWSFTLPDELLVRRFQGKLLTRELARRVLPREVVDRPKRGFGAPSTTLQTNNTHGQRGHRQGRYFALACSVLDNWLLRTGATPEWV